MKVMHNEIILNKLALILVRRQRAQALAKRQIKLVQDNKKIRKLKKKKGSWTVIHLWLLGRNGQGQIKLQLFSLRWPLRNTPEINTKNHYKNHYLKTFITNNWQISFFILASNFQVVGFDPQANYKVNFVGLDQLLCLK